MLIKQALFSFLVTSLASLSIAFAEDSEEWSCESDNNGLPQSLSVQVEKGEVVSFEYSGMAPSASGDTFYSCYLSAKKGSKDSKWETKGNKSNIAFLETAQPEDTALVTRNQNTFKFEFDVSPTNCGSSTPIASTISISKGQKKCHDIELS